MPGHPGCALCAASRRRREPPRSRQRLRESALQGSRGEGAGGGAVQASLRPSSPPCSPAGHAAARAGGGLSVPRAWRPLGRPAGPPALAPVRLGHTADTAHALVSPLPHPPPSPPSWSQEPHPNGSLHRGDPPGRRPTPSPPPPAAGGGGVRAAACPLACPTRSTLAVGLASRLVGRPGSWKPPTCGAVTAPFVQVVTPSPPPSRSVVPSRPSHHRSPFHACRLYGWPSSLTASTVTPPPLLSFVTPLPPSPQPPIDLTALAL